MRDYGETPGPGAVRVILFDGARFASTDVDRHALERFPELRESTVSALLTVLGGSTIRSSGR